MSQKSDFSKTIGALTGAVIFAILTYPLLKLSGIIDMLAYLSVEYSKIIFQICGFKF